MKRHHFIFQIIISDAKSCLLFIFFVNSHLIIKINQIKLGKLLSATQPISKIADEKQQISIFDDKIIKILIIDICTRTIIRLLKQKNRNTWKQFETSYKTIG